MNDCELMEKIRSGDGDSFRKLVEKYQRRAIGFALQLLGDYQEAEDMSQEAFLRILKALDTYREYGKFEIYFFFILKNLCLNRINKRKRERKLDPQEARAIPTQEGNPRESLLEAESANLLHLALKELREKERIAIFLKEYEKLKYSEIAQILGIGLSDVKVTIHRALKKLKQRLEKTWIAEK